MYYITVSSQTIFSTYKTLQIFYIAISNSTFFPKYNIFFKRFISQLGFQFLGYSQELCNSAVNYLNFSRLTDPQNSNRSKKGSILISISHQLKLIGSIEINQSDPD